MLLVAEQSIRSSCAPHLHLPLSRLRRSFLLLSHLRHLLRRLLRRSPHLMMLEDHRRHPR